jgi:hypothetical protein
MSARSYQDAPSDTTEDFRKLEASGNRRAVQAGNEKSACAEQQATVREIIYSRNLMINKYRIVVNIFLIFVFNLFHSCNSGQIIQNTILPVDTLDTRVYNETCAAFFADTYEITLSGFETKNLKKLIKNNRSGFVEGTDLVFFGLIISNTGTVPVETDEIFLEYNNNVYQAFTPQSLKMNKPDSAIDYDSIFSLYNVDSEEFCLEDIDLKNELSKHNDNIIKPDEKVLKIVAFEWIPAQIRYFSISVQVKSEIISKKILFKFKKYEYRESGKHFIEQNKKDSIYDY